MKKYLFLTQHARIFFLIFSLLRNVRTQTNKIHSLFCLYPFLSRSYLVIDNGTFLYVLLKFSKLPLPSLRSSLKREIVGRWLKVKVELFPARGSAPQVSLYLSPSFSHNLFLSLLGYVEGYELLSRGWVNEWKREKEKEEKPRVVAYDPGWV